jgi:hypothetical protein
VDPLLVLTCDAFVARCLRRLLTSERAAVLLANAGSAPATGLAGVRRVQGGSRESGRRQGRAVQPAVHGDWQAAVQNEFDVAGLRRRYPWVVALLRELSGV